MFKTISLIGVLVLSVMTMACGGGDDAPKNGAPATGGGPLNSQKYEYEIVTQRNGWQCTTGRHTFYDFAQYCDALEVNAMNNNCAYYERQDLYQRMGCPNTFVARY